MPDGWLAYGLLGWWCCGQPVVALWVGVLIGRYGGVRGAITYLLDRLGVPRL